MELDIRASTHLRIALVMYEVRGEQGHRCWHGQMNLNDYQRRNILLYRFGFSAEELAAGCRKGGQQSVARNAISPGHCYRLETSKSRSNRRRTKRAKSCRRRQAGRSAKRKERPTTASVALNGTSNRDGDENNERQNKQIKTLID